MYLFEFENKIKPSTKLQPDCKYGLTQMDMAQINMSLLRVSIAEMELVEVGGGRTKTWINHYQSLG